PRTHKVVEAEVQERRQPDQTESNVSDDDPEAEGVGIQQRMTKPVEEADGGEVCAGGAEQWGGEEDGSKQPLHARPERGNVRSRTSPRRRRRWQADRIGFVHG